MAISFKKKKEKGLSTAAKVGAGIGAAAGLAATGLAVKRGLGKKAAIGGQKLLSSGKSNTTKSVRNGTLTTPPTTPDPFKTAPTSSALPKKSGKSSSTQMKALPEGKSKGGTLATTKSARKPSLADNIATKAATTKAKASYLLQNIGSKVKNTTNPKLKKQSGKRKKGEKQPFADPFSYSQNDVDISKFSFSFKKKRI